jgi:hypothetical protein
MTKIRMFMFAAVAVIVAFGMVGQQALALDVHFHSMIIGKADVPDVMPDAASQLHQLITVMAVASPETSSSNFYWPCFTGGSDPLCSSIPAGGVVLGAPFYTWPLTTCTSSTAACGQIYWLFETDVASTKAAIDVSVTVTQGTSTIYNTGTVDVGTNPGAGYVEVIWADVGFGPGDCATGTCATPVAGAATITTTTTVGKQKATGKATITLSATE